MLALVLAPLVAVLPFRDVSGGGAGGVGEAVRGAAVAELKAAGVATVPRDTVERAIDVVAVLGTEIEKQEQDASPPLAKLARSTGATAVLAGAYDVRGDQVKLWARFYQGKRGRLLATTTVSGQGSEFLQLVHGLDVELLRAVKAEVKLDPKPLVRSIRAVDLYGQSEAAPSDDKRRDLLQRAVDEDPTFELAVRALEALPADPARVTELLLSRFGELSRQRKFHQLLAEATAAAAHPPAPMPELSEQVADVAQVMIVVAHDRLHDDEAVMREGQKYLATHAGAKSAAGVKALVDQAEERRRARFEGVLKATEAISKLSAEERKDACRVATLYEDASQLREARDAYDKCVGSGRRPEYLAHLIWIEFRLGNFAAVPSLLEKLRAASPALYQQASHLADELPAD